MYRSASTLVDGETFRSAQAGDPTAIQTLLIRLQPDVRRYARKHCRSSSAIEDVVQEGGLCQAECLLIDRTCGPEHGVPIGLQAVG